IANHNPYASNPPSDFLFEIDGCYAHEDILQAGMGPISQTDITQKIRDQLKQIRDRIGTLLPGQLSVLKSLPKHMQELDNSIKVVKEVIEIKDADRIDDLFESRKAYQDERGPFGPRYDVDDPEKSAAIKDLSGGIPLSERAVAV
ncbi:hypothetical protein RFI_26630, partial [Reticulomyxa filosa]